MAPATALSYALVTLAGIVLSPIIGPAADVDEFPEIIFFALSFKLEAKFFILLPPDAALLAACSVTTSAAILLPPAPASVTGTNASVFFTTFSATLSACSLASFPIRTSVAIPSFNNCCFIIFFAASPSACGIVPSFIPCFILFSFSVNSYSFLIISSALLVAVLVKPSVVVNALVVSSEVPINAFAASSVLSAAAFPALRLEILFPIAFIPLSIITTVAASIAPCFVPSHIIDPVLYVSSKLASPLASYTRCCC